MVLRKGRMMKSFSLCKVILAVIFCVLIFLPYGCAWNQLGETTAEGHRRHKRALRINQQEFWSDVDTVLMLDEPSKLTDKRVP